MHNLSKNLLLLLLLFSITSMYSCDDEFNEGPFDVPDATPKIKYVNLLRTYDGEVETLELTIDIVDGDFDLGFQSLDNILPPYQQFDFVLNDDGEPIRIGDDSNNPPFSCSNYFVAVNDIGIETDTFLIRQNPFFYNIAVDFFIENPRGAGQFQLLDWRDVTSEFGCGRNFHGRFQDPGSSVTNTGFSFEKTGPFTTRMTYSMQSVGFPFVLGTRPFYIACSIWDRALNQSNVIATPEMVY